MPGEDPALCVRTRLAPTSLSGAAVLSERREPNPLDDQAAPKRAYRRSLGAMDIEICVWD